MTAKASSAGVSVSYWTTVRERLLPGVKSAETGARDGGTLPSSATAFTTDSFERGGAGRSSSASPNLVRLVETALEARDILGTSDEQVIPGLKEYLFPDKPAPLKGWAGLKTSLLGDRGLLAGLKEMFVSRRIGRGFAKVLSSMIFMPFQLVATIIDLPRLAGDHIVVASKKLVLRAIAADGMKQSLMTMAGGALQAVGGIVRLAVPVSALLLGTLAGGWPGILAAGLFEAVYFGEDLAKLGAGEVEDMLLFQGLRDIVGGISVMLGAEFITSMGRQIARKQLRQMSPQQYGELGFLPEQIESLKAQDATQMV